MDILKKRWIYAFGGVFVLLFMGCSYAWSIFVVPLENAYHWTRSQTSLAFTFNLIFFSLGSLFVGFFSKKLSFSSLLKIAACMIGLGFYSSSFITEAKFIYFTYSFLCGCGIGAGYSCVISAIPLWFPDKQGMITGILLMGYALSTALFGPLINRLISYTNISITFRLLGIICFIALMIGSFLIIIPNHHQIQQLPHIVNQKKEYNLITKEMIKKPIFWIYYILSALHAGVGLTMINHASPILIEDLLILSSTSSLIISLLSLCNGFGRVIWGILFDKQGVKKIMISISSLMIFSILGILISLYCHSFLCFVISACLLLFVFGGNAALMPTMIRELFGHRTYSLNYSILSTSCLIQSSLPTLIGTLHTYTHSYLLPFLCLFIIEIFNLIFLILLISFYKKDYIEC